MELRYRMAVVTGAGGGLGREVAVALARRGMSVLVADRDRAGAEETAALVRACRVAAWSFQVDLADETDVRLLAERMRDLGGADVLVSTGDVAAPGPRRQLRRMFLDGLARRRTPGAPAALVDVRAGELSPTGSQPPSVDPPGRMMSVIVGRADSAAVCAAVLDLLAHGRARQVVELAPVGG